MPYIMWRMLLKSLQGFASKHELMAGIDVREGSKRPKDPYPCVELIWSEEDALNLFRTNEGELMFWLDCWVRNDDTAPSGGYDAMGDMQEKLCQVVVEWTDAVLEEMDLLINAQLNGIVSDGNNNRALGGSRMILNLKWKRAD